jgi:hypothetical protein
MGGGSPAGRVSPRRARHFSLRRQRKVPKRKATRWSGSFRFAPGNLRCSTKAGSRSNSLRSDNREPWSAFACAPRPSPTGVGKWIPKTNTNAGRRGRAKRVLAGARFRTRSRAHHPSGCAEERRSSRIRTGDCLSVASSSPAPAGPSTAGCPPSASEGGRRQQGRLSFASFSLARQRKGSCRRATPGVLANHEQPKQRRLQQAQPERRNTPRAEWPKIRP